MSNTKARSFVTITIIIAICALGLRYAAQQIIKMSIAQNESNAASTLKLMSAALENYAADNKGKYPDTVSALFNTDPRYLDRNYVEESPIKGYAFSCSRLESSSYSCSALPVRCNLSGKKSFFVATGGSLSFEDCTK